MVLQAPPYSYTYSYTRISQSVDANGDRTEEESVDANGDERAVDE
jgi:hypothetical protein